MTKVVVLHDNPEWIPPFARAFEAEGVELEPVLFDEFTLPLDAQAEPAIYWSRLSASAHTRGRPFAKDAARSILSALEAQGQRVVNGSRVVELEVSKVKQHALLRAAGFDVPRTTAVVGKAGLSAAAREFPAPFISKHNQGGKGLGVRRFETHEEFDAYVAGDEFEAPIDGITLIQELLIGTAPFVTRAEFIGGRFAYAVRVDTSQGGFELCPAEACAVPTGDEVPPPLFSLREEITAEYPLIQQLERFLAEAGVEIAGVEFIETIDGRVVPYDVNTNTNYSPDVEGSLPESAATKVARFLQSLAPATVAV
ncbi:ATP-grasp domain-containing protein [Humidisolicoccus flavus]|uniref:ATP-grasp domain-containing protein n=1 Tax=Humidisolicoccus flavus TaxID=3111414 RepID=UPI0032528E64